MLSQRWVARKGVSFTAGRYDPGGGGLNVARVVTTLGGAATAVYPVGGPTGEMLRPHIVSERSSGNQYRFVLPGPHLTTEEQDICLNALAMMKPRPAAIVVSGSLPPGVGRDFLFRVGRLAAQYGTRLFLDTSGPALAGAAGIGGYLVKPNLRELSAFVDRPLQSSREQITAVNAGPARCPDRDRLVRCRRCTHRHDRRCRMPAYTRCYHSQLSRRRDSMMGAIATRLVGGASLRDTAPDGLAAGAAAILTDGTELCRRGSQLDGGCRELWRSANAAVSKAAAVLRRLGGAIVARAAIALILAVGTAPKGGAKAPP